MAGADGGVTFPSMEIPSEVGDAQSSRGVGDASGSRRKDPVSSPGADEISREMSPIPGGASDSASRCFSCRKSRGVRIADQEPPLATELRGRLDDGRFSERRLQLRGGRKVQFFLGPEVEGQRAEDQIRREPRAGGSFTLHRHARFRGGGNLRLRFPDGPGGRLRGGGEEAVEGQIHIVLPRLRRFRGGGGQFLRSGLRRPGWEQGRGSGSRPGTGSRDSRRRNPAPRSRGRRNRPRPAPEGRERERRP